MAQETFSRRSEAAEPGTVVAVGDSTDPTLVFDAAAPDQGVKFILQNNSDTDITVRPAADGAAPNEGIVLKASGGTWEEDRYAGPVSACHHGVGGTKDLTVVIV